MELQQAIFGLGTGEMMLILVVVIILFGPKKLPELAKGLGKGMREFRKASSDMGRSIQDASYEEEKTAPPAAAQLETPEPAAAATPAAKVETAAEPRD
jgi:sec-independent protein translocase protein TatA